LTVCFWLAGCDKYRLNAPNSDKVIQAMNTSMKINSATLQGGEKSIPDPMWNNLTPCVIKTRCPSTSKTIYLTVFVSNRHVESHEQLIIFTADSLGMNMQRPAASLK
jgi:hypothetical protein